MGETWTTCKVDRRRVQIWFALSISACLAHASVMAWIEPTSLILTCPVYASLVTIGGAFIVRSQFRYNDQQIQCRYLWSYERDWEDANGWSYSVMGGKLSFFIRFADGLVVGSTPLLLNRIEVMKLIPVLMEKIGEPERGDRMILPWPINVFESIRRGKRSR